MCAQLILFIETFISNHRFFNQLNLFIGAFVLNRFLKLYLVTRECMKEETAFIIRLKKIS